MPRYITDIAETSSDEENADGEYLDTENYDEKNIVKNKFRF